jgi:hypothetical protein
MVLWEIRRKPASAGKLQWTDITRDIAVPQVRLEPTLAKARRFVVSAHGRNEQQILDCV